MKILNLKSIGISSLFLIFAFAGMTILQSSALMKDRQITGLATDLKTGKAIQGLKVSVHGTSKSSLTNAKGYYVITVSGVDKLLIFSHKDYTTQRISITRETQVNIKMEALIKIVEIIETVDDIEADEDVETYYDVTKKEDQAKQYEAEARRKQEAASISREIYQPKSISGAGIKKTKGYRNRRNGNSSINYNSVSHDVKPIEHNTEEYDVINENKFKSVKTNPLSTFSVDVDRASYSNTRRFLNNNQLPQKDVVRIEELINYFHYDYPQPSGVDPFTTNLEMGTCPWNKNHYLVNIGIQGKEIPVEELPASNLVFLLDVSGSMNNANKLPLLKKAFKILVDKLGKDDRVAMVVYAGAAGVVLPSTSGKEKDKIIAALDNLSAGGSTAGGAGIELAYKIAKENFIKNGNNRVILATDGDFNIGQSSDASLVRMIEKKRDDNVFLTILGFGMGNYKDSKMEQLSNAGNGNYAYIDNVLEAKKTLGKEIWGTLFTIAKDVKIQIEFNPAKVKAYRLIGYENRMLAAEDFNNDKKDAGEIGAGHTVTAIYEIIPASSEETIEGVDDLEYQDTKIKKSDNLMTLKLRYKKPDGKESKLIVTRVKGDNIKTSGFSNNFNFSASVAQFGMLLRDSEFKGTTTFKNTLSLAKSAKGKDNDGYRAEFIKLIEIAELLSK